MTLDEILSATPTESQFISRCMLVEIMHKEGWRCYSSKHYWNTMTLIERFLRSHARLPGLVSEEIFASIPATILHYDQDDGEIVRGATFLNGAVILVHKPGIEKVLSLFVDDTTAEKWGYPDKYVYLPEYERQNESP